MGLMVRMVRMVKARRSLKAWGSRALLVAILAALVPMVAFTLTSCSLGATSTATDPFSGTHTYGMSTPVSADNTWRITPTSVQTSQGQDADVPNPGDVYLLVGLSFKNVTSSTQALYTVTKLTLKDAAGGRYTQLSNSLSASPDGDVPAGQTKAGTFVFEVPFAQTTFVLAYQDPGFSAAPVQWSITRS